MTSVPELYKARTTWCKGGQKAIHVRAHRLLPARLAKYKCPKQIRFVDALPKNPVGTILRKELRALAT